MVEYFMYCHPSYYRAACRKVFSEAVHSKSQEILLREVREERSAILIPVTQWGVLAPRNIVKLKKQPTPKKQPTKI